MGSVVDKGGNRETLLPSLLLSSSCLASSRLCMANMSKGDIDGGMSPAKCCILGDGNGCGEVWVLRVCTVSDDLALRSMKLGRSMVMYVVLSYAGSG